MCLMVECPLNGTERWKRSPPPSHPPTPMPFPPRTNQRLFFPPTGPGEHHPAERADGEAEEEHRHRALRLREQRAYARPSFLCLVALKTVWTFPHPRSQPHPLPPTAPHSIPPWTTLNNSQPPNQPPTNTATGGATRRALLRQRPLLHLRRLSRRDAAARLQLRGRHARPGKA